MSPTQPIIFKKSDKEPLRIDDAMLLYRMTDGTVSESVDFVWAELDGAHSRRTNNRSTKIYAVGAGELDVVIGNERRTLTFGDVCVVPPNIACELFGRKAVLGIICAPAFDPKDESNS